MFFEGVKRKVLYAALVKVRNFSCIDGRQGESKWQRYLDGQVMGSGGGCKRSGGSAVEGVTWSPGYICVWV